MPLSNKQQVFVERYLATWNATQAALAAGYSARSARSIGSENLTKPDIQAAIQARLDEECMSPKEVLHRLAQHGRADMGEWLDDDGNIDIAQMKHAHATRLLKKVKRTERSGESRDGGSWQYVTVEVELHDAQAALVQIGRHHKLFAEKLDVDIHGNVAVTGDEMVIARNEARLAEQRLLEVEDGSPTED